MIIDAVLLAVAIVLTISALGCMIFLSPAIHRKIVKNKRDELDREIARLEKELGSDQKG